MKKILSIFSVSLFVLFFISPVYGQLFVRVGELPLPSPENASFGNMVAGADFDNDGKGEIYLPNNDWTDLGQELLPTIYKYEYDGAVDFNVVWKSTLAPKFLTKQNTWPALTWGDLDKDGRQEIIWGPVNFSPYTSNHPRVFVFEYAGDGSDNLGVPDPDSVGNWLPNSWWAIDTASGLNLRPFRWWVADPDSDGTNELLFCTRAGSYSFGVGSVSSIPNNADGSETWTLEFSGGPTGVFYDLAVIDNHVYLIQDNGNVVPIVYSTGTWTVLPTQTGLVPGGSWESASVVDLNNDGTKEIVVAGNGSTQRRIYLLQQSGDTLIATSIANMASLIGAGRLYGGASGDIDLNGMMDFVFGTRDATPNVAILRLEYLGGSITDSTSYAATVIDQLYQPTGGRWMFTAIANVDGDPKLEVLYSEGTGELAPVIILDIEGQLPVELTSFSASVVDGFVQLNWSTATEINNRGFEIQRKLNNGEFATIGFVNGKGSTTNPQAYSFVDNNISQGAYSYRLKQVDFDGTYKFSNAIEVNLNVPYEFNLAQNFPNPFNPITTIRFELAKESRVSLKIFNTLGEEVAALINNEFKNAGTYDVTFDASSLASGTYIYRLQAGDVVFIKKMMLTK